MSPSRLGLTLLVALALAGACRSHASADTGSEGAEDDPPPPDLAATVPVSAHDAGAPVEAPPLSCPPGMMAVADRFCIDRWEASLVDASTGEPLSPYYPPDRALAVKIAETWEALRFRYGSKAAHEVPLPPLPAWQREHEATPMAVSLPGVVPSGYLSWNMAEQACKNAGKRLCRADEWVLACGGEHRRLFPYGRVYRQGACNTFRLWHPAVELHGSAILGHDDPRLNLVRDPSGDPLLRPTGATPACKSEWGGDAAWDMNGNLDEWVDGGRLMGAFFSRSRKNGCGSSIRAHPKQYFDYSTGTRCCWSPPPASKAPGG